MVREDTSQGGGMREMVGEDTNREKVNIWYYLLVYYSWLAEVKATAVSAYQGKGHILSPLKPMQRLFELIKARAFQIAFLRHMLLTFHFLHQLYLF